MESLDISKLHLVKEGDELDFNNVFQVARAIQLNCHFAKDRDRLFWYDNGVYKPGGEERAKELYAKLLEKAGMQKKWKYNMQLHIIPRIMAEVDQIDAVPDLNWINVKNGLLDWRNNILRPHDPTYRTLIQIPITYDQKATCPYWDSFLTEILPTGEDFLIELVGLCMIPFMELQKSIILVGGGNNGKSTYLNALQAAVGRENICHVSLQALGNPNNRFVTSRLYGKLVNIQGDLPASKIEDTSKIKEIIGQDGIDAEYKGKQGFSFKPFCRLIFSTNYPVRSDDESDGWKRRFIQVPFTKQFRDDPTKAKELIEGLTDPGELSGLLNKIAYRLPQVEEDGFSFSESLAATITNWVSMPEQTKLWFRQVIVSDPNGSIPSSAFYNYFMEKCPHWDGARSRVKTVAYVRAIFPEVQANQLCSYNGKQVRSYVGVRMRDPEVQKLLESLAGILSNQ